MGQQVYSESPENVFNPVVSQTDWLEIITSDSSPSETHLSNCSQEATLVGYIPWNKQRSAAVWFLGFSYVDENYVLHRANPEAHPVFSWLFASEISFKPFVPTANLLNPSAPLQFVSPWYNPGSSGFIQINIANHRLAICSVKFRSFRYNFFDDSQITVPSQEFYRNNYLEIDPSVEVLSCDGISQLNFAETVSSGPGGPQIGKPFPAPIPQLLSKCRFTMNWLQLPFDFLSTTEAYFYPQNILQCVGLVNSQPFPAAAPAEEQFDPGTLLMEAPKFTQTVYPVAPADPNVPLIAVDCSIPMNYFNPPKGNLSSSYRGHNLMPWRGGALAGGGIDPSGGKFFYCTRGGQPNAPPLLGSIDYNQIFVSPNG